MHCSEDILISVRPDYVVKLLEGDKTVELRRRAVRVLPGTRVWLYATLPVGRIVGFGEVQSVHEHSPVEIWKEFGGRAGITEDHFFDYFDGVSRGCAIVFRQVVRSQRELELSELRSSLGTFHAPQFFRKISRGSDEMRLLENALRETGSENATCCCGCQLCEVLGMARSCH